MGILLTGITSSYVQFITVLLVFVLVLGITAFTTRWMANYQKQQGAGGNIQVIETSRISNNKYVQIVRVGKTYMVIAVGKDTVTMLGEVPEEQLNLENAGQGMRFREILDRAARKNTSPEETEESRDHDEQ